MSWPEAFVTAVLMVTIFAYLYLDNRLRAQIMIEALKNGHDSVEIK